MSELNGEVFIDLDEDNIVTLTDEQGNDVDFILLDVVEHEGSDYLVLFPLGTDEDDENFDDEGVVIMRAFTTEEGEVYENVEDDAILETVHRKFVEQNPPSPDEDDEEE